MRIKSDFHDYYDGVQATGQDDSVFYLRKKSVLKEGSIPHIAAPIVPDEMYLREFDIAFCGKLYKTIQVRYGNRMEVRCSIECSAKDAELTTCATMEDFDRFLAEKTSEEFQEVFDSKKNLRFMRRYAYGGNSRREQFKRFFEEASKNLPVKEDIFLKHRAPIFVFRQHTPYGYRYLGDYGRQLEVNSNLQEIGFPKFLDSFRAFQEISMFLGNMAVPEKEIPPISDEIMRDIKGFDRWSFKKEPSKK